MHYITGQKADSQAGSLPFVCRAGMGLEVNCRIKGGHTGLAPNPAGNGRSQDLRHCFAYGA